MEAVLTGNAVPEPALDAWLDAPTHARSEAAPAPGRFPLVLVGQGNGQTLADQALLAELVASHGYVVATSPSQIRLGTSMASEADVLPSAREQARDLAFAALRVAPLPFVDAHQLAFVGHSFGARSALLAALQEPRTVALVSLDGGIGAATAKTWLDADPGLDPERRASRYYTSTRPRTPSWRRTSRSSSACGCARGGSSASRACTIATSAATASRRRRSRN